MNKELDEINEKLIDLLHRHYYPTMHESIADATLCELAKEILCLETADGRIAVVRKEQEIPYEWSVITRKHNYPPYKRFTTYALREKDSYLMFGYVQKYQSLTGYKCFEKPIRFTAYLGNEEYARSECSKATLKEAKAKLIGLFMEDRKHKMKIPIGFVQEIHGE